MALSRCESAILRRDRRSAGIAAPTVVALIWLGFAPCPTPSLAARLDTWRSEAARIRVLAENDAPNAYEAAQRPIDHESTVNIISHGDGGTLPYHFDPAVLTCFLARVNRFEAIYEEYADK